ncbi:(2Fe-2S) ferredoxin domain-containing protein [Azoarcus communis]|jgi:(2Fe-2S) ferredoxin|uniref:(2Fe-2S) ferredoxin domain-containing protein n=1 Tax=Parazoarcus communis SWub3 = DSM 12120 TaxID=1121029 RepID=A0A323V1K4_9RHOO|nr:(2Fe-2S) ferredoxin domain-containing protein [Parazoarcus communis]NMG49330.1 (2Fe-2S) ferredoxin domain-containing protein [Parazoarcus communis]NMG69408.1 (2Fe-2S) ferredoxin domain-containing protein [Parazoarcus communis SWub3 = DSM 12120]PZA17356.1 (2Fe-2S) ferredoxin domain-containing protein [Azoarcus communis] [Parazoarcus communis SWub3 = DSM 12120]
MPKPKKHILICVQGRPAGHPRGSCQQKGCNEIYQGFMEAFQARNLWADYLLTNTGCLGPCTSGPNVLVYPEGLMYSGVAASDIATIIDEHLIGDKPVERLMAPASVW